MGVIFGSLPAPPNAPVQWTGLAMKWIGADGSEWTLSDSTDGTVMMPGVRGMTMPPIIHHRAAHASVPGARWRGLHVDVREVFWPLQVYTGDGSDAWVEKDRAFWESMDPQTTGTWVVTTPDGRSRSIKLRFADDGSATFDHDVVQDGWASYGITMHAEQPFWEGESITGSWEATAPSPFFPASGGPGFKISGGGNLTEAEIANPGDVETYVVWRIYGPVTSAVVGINGRTITVPFTIDDGKYVRIDTNPSAQTALQGNVGGTLSSDKTGLLTDITFAPLPAKSTSKLSLTVAGTGRVTATFTPRYYRAW
jgi:hypothetical protein